MRVSILTVCFLFICVINLYSQTGSIAGKIQLGHTQQSIADVYVYLEGTSYYGISNAQGDYLITDIPEGRYMVITSMIGFQEAQKEVKISIGEKTIADFALRESINDLPLVEINARNGTGGLLGSFDLASSAHFISKKDIDQLNTHNIHEILQNIPGVQLQEEDGFGLRPNIGLRGTGSERSSKITILEDGILAAPAPYAAPSAYYFPTVARMEAIEVMKGASQIKYGPYTTGGAINFISTSIPNEFRGNISLSLGNFGMRQLRANLGNKINNISFLIEGMQTQSDGFKKIQNTNDKTGFDKKDWLLKMKWENISSSPIYQKLEFKYAETREISNETYLGLARPAFIKQPYNRYAASQKDRMTTEHRQLNLNYLINPMKNLYFQSTAYHNDFFRNWYKLDKVQNAMGDKVSIAKILENPHSYDQEIEILNGRASVGNEHLHVKANNRNYISRGIQSKLNYFHKQHAFEFGFRAHYDEMDRFQWIDEYQMKSSKMSLAASGSPGSESNRIESALAYSSYLKYEVELSKFSLNMGLRNEKITMKRLDYGTEDQERNGRNISNRVNHTNVIIPGATVKFAINESNHLFMGVHRGFSPAGSSQENRPEFSTNYEVGYKIQKSILNGSAVLFRNNYSNLLGADLSSSGGSGSGEMFNGGAATAQGLELSLSYRIPVIKNIYIPVASQYTYTDAYFDTHFESDFGPWGVVSAGDHLPYLAKNTFSVRTGWSATKYQMYFSGNYMGAMSTTASKQISDDANYIKPRWLMNLDLSLLLSKNTKITFAVHNLANITYVVANRPAGLRPGIPRQFSIRLTSSF